MTQRAALTASVLLLLLTGCGQVEGAVTSAASGAAGQVGQVAADQVRSQICAQVRKQQLSAQDQQLLASLLPAAKAAGLPAAFVAPLEDVARAGDQPTAQSISALRQACDPSRSPAP